MEIETIEGELWELSSQFEIWQHRRNARASISDAEAEACGGDVATCSGARQSVKAHCMRSTSVGIVRLSSYARFETCSKRAGSFVHPRLCVCKEGTLSHAAGVGRPHSDNPNPGGTAYWRRFRMEPIRGVGSGGGGASDRAGAVGDNETAAENGAAAGGGGDDNEPSTLYLVHEEFGPEGSDVPTAVHVRVANTGSHDACVLVQSPGTVNNAPRRPPFVSTSVLPAVRSVPAGRSVVIATVGGFAAGSVPALRGTVLISGPGSPCAGGADGPLQGNAEPCPRPHGPFLLEDSTRRVHLPNSVALEAPVRPGSSKMLVEVRGLSEMALTEWVDSIVHLRLTACSVPSADVVGFVEGGQSIDLEGIVGLGKGGILGITPELKDPPGPDHPRRVCSWKITTKRVLLDLIGRSLRTLQEEF
jgi:hypothetical protein